MVHGNLVNRGLEELNRLRREVEHFRDSLVYKMQQSPLPAQPEVELGVQQRCTRLIVGIEDLKQYIRESRRQHG